MIDVLLTKEIKIEPVKCRSCAQTLHEVQVVLRIQVWVPNKLMCRPGKRNSTIGNNGQSDDFISD